MQELLGDVRKAIGELCVEQKIKRLFWMMSIQMDEVEEIAKERFS